LASLSLSFLNLANCDGKNANIRFLSVQCC
jgi:hypothetical protein